MLVRCERCRAVFRVANTLPGTALECSRCHHVFPAPEHEPVALVPQGTLGGAAAIALANRLSPGAPTEEAPPAPRPRRGTNTVTVVALGVVIAVLLVLALHPPHRAEKPPNVELSAQVKAAHSLVRRDDTASLERAISDLTEAETHEPGQVELRSEKALAMLLLGSALRAESDDLLAELSRSVPTADVLAALPESERTAAVQRAASARERLPALTARSDSLLRDGIALARDTLEPNARRPEAQLRAVWLADAFDHRADRLQAPPDGKADDADHAESLAWWHFARAIIAASGEASPGAQAQEEKELQAALQADPGQLRAKWQLARLLLVRTPPDAKAGPLLAEVLSVNPNHGGAQRDKARLFEAQTTTAANAP